MTVDQMVELLFPKVGQWIKTHRELSMPRNQPAGLFLPILQKRVANKQNRAEDTRVF